jgi:hypothetical protein
MADSVTFTTWSANAGQLCQLVDHLAFDQRGIHIEGKETPVPAEDTFPLEGDIDFKIMRGLEKRRAHRLLGGCIYRSPSIRRTRFASGVCTARDNRPESRSIRSTFKPCCGDNAAHPRKVTFALKWPVRG